MTNQNVQKDKREKSAEDQDSSLPVPTDYRRNVWILIMMVTVIILASIISLLTG